MRLTIWGAARQVTGSMHLLEVQNNDKIFKILIDCGINYERRDMIANQGFPFDPALIDLVVLTHAHIDHSGNLPTLVKDGFDGPIFSSNATADLSYLLMSDSVSVFLSKQASKSPISRHKKKKKIQPLYLQREVEACMKHFTEIPLNQAFQFNDFISLELIPVGHLLGAAGVLFKVQENGEEKTIFFSGDVGRHHYPILEGPQNIPDTDYLVCESTYGGRFHTRDSSVEQTLIEHIQKTCIDQPGRLIIPAFSVGRTQALVYSLNKIFYEKLLPPIRIFVDSPLGIYSTEIYRKHRKLLNQESQAFYERTGDEFEFENLHYVEDIRESKRISSYLEPCIIVSSAGMLEGGRIQDHLYHNIQNFYCTILFIGYCAKGTLGRRLLDGELNVRIHERDMDVYARIASTDVLSAHADQDELIQFIKTADSKKLKKIFLVHGETQSMEDLASALSKENYEVEIPERGVSYWIS